MGGGIGAGGGGGVGAGVGAGVGMEVHNHTLFYQAITMIQFLVYHELTSNVGVRVR
jgi:hypothetical protein